MDDDEEILMRVAADSASFRRSVDDMRAAMQEELVTAADAAGRGIETALRKAARSGTIAMEDLAKVAGRVLGEVAASALSPGYGGRLDGLLGGATSGLLGLAGRATGGPVSPGQAYVVGERGPEIFVPTSSGRVETGAPARGPINLTVNVSGDSEASSAFMARTARQVTRGVRRAIEQTGV